MRSARQARSAEDRTFTAQPGQAGSGKKAFSQNAASSTPWYEVGMHGARRLSIGLAGVSVFRGILGSVAKQGGPRGTALASEPPDTRMGRIS